MTTQEKPSHVSVQLTDCAREDADTVLAVLWSAFPQSADRRSEVSGRAHDTDAEGPTVWTVTVETVGEVGPGERPRLSGPVTTTLAGGYHAVDLVRQALTSVFVVEDLGSVSGDQEQEVRLRMLSSNGWADGGPRAEESDR